MLKNKKKGFVLMEAIVVIVVISVALITLFTSYNKILSKVNEENKYDLSEYLYKTYYIREYLRTNITGEDKIFDIGNANNSDNLINYSTELYNGISVLTTFSSYEIKNIYILTNLNGEKTNENLRYFDAYMIDYIRQLDVDDKDTLIIVEYSKLARDMKYNTLKIYNSTDKELVETYIASLEW